MTYINIDGTLTLGSCRVSVYVRKVGLNILEGHPSSHPPTRPEWEGFELSLFYLLGRFTQTLHRESVPGQVDAGLLAELPEEVLAGEREERTEKTHTHTHGRRRRRRGQEKNTHTHTHTHSVRVEKRDQVNITHREGIARAVKREPNSAARTKRNFDHFT